jgi:single-stranded-DNA-specific exonuclease
LPTAFRQCAAAALTPELLQADVLSDGELAANEFDRAMAEALRDGGPWGQGFPEPQFDGEFEVLSWRVLGRAPSQVRTGPGRQAPQCHRVRWLGR